MHANDPEPLRAVPSAHLCSVPCFNGHLVARLREALPEPSRLERAQALFAALADGQRLKILLALDGGQELCVCDLAHVLGVSVSAASHHLRKLRGMGILADRSDGRMVYYSLREAEVVRLVSRVLAAGSRTPTPTTESP